MKTTDNYLIFNHKEEIKEELAKKLDIRKYCKCQNEKWTIDFIGFIYCKNGRSIISFPDHFYAEETDIIILKQLFLKINLNVSGVFENNQITNNFPISAYLAIYSYYHQFGLHTFSERQYFSGYSSKISWNKTLQKSPVYFSNNQVVMFPFICEKQVNYESFVAQCMIYVINDGFKRLGQDFKFGTFINQQINVDIFENSPQYIVQNLKSLLSTTFKDIEHRLIINLIFYFEWQSYLDSNKTLFLIRNFNHIWEKIMDTFLLNSYNELAKLGNSKNPDVFPISLVKFNKQVKQKIDNAIQTEVIYDFLSKNSDNIYVFDAKYYHHISDFNYKQIAYHFLVQALPKQRIERFSDKKPKVVNALLSPSEKSEIVAKVHIDMTENEKFSQDIFSDFYIVEFQIPVRLAIQVYLKE
ncbi:hypothetical protein FACS1894193_06210 [Bacilli bacterium]|nr:hypothetical protein FACS1894193_06210 [Bacilli bacterium]GHU46178.1 hypothetical protein FACS1894194_3400 [Bacilli bacterium]